MIKTVKFSSFDGTHLEGIFVCPKQEAKAAVLMLHGCPSEKNEDGFYSETPDDDRDYKQKGGMVEYFLDQGIASFRFDFREHGDSECTKNSSNLLVSGMINDVESAYNVLYKLVPQNTPMIIVAASFAGGIAINWLYIYKRKIARLFLLAPLLDFASTIKKHNITSIEDGFESLSNECAITLRKVGYIEYGEKKMNKAFINEALLMNIEDSFCRLECKSTIIHGTGDFVIPYYTSERFVKEYNQDCELIPIPNAVHGFGVKDDYEWTDRESLKNHEIIYSKMIERILHDK